MQGSEREWIHADFRMRVFLSGEGPRCRHRVVLTGTRTGRTYEREGAQHGLVLILFTLARIFQRIAQEARTPAPASPGAPVHTEREDR